MAVEVAVDLHALRETLEIERDKILAFMEENVTTLGDDEYNKLSSRHRELVSEVKRLNGLSAMLTVQGLEIEAQTIKITTAKINETVITLKKVGKTIALVGDLLSLSAAIISPDPKAIADAITSATNRINAW